MSEAADRTDVEWWRRAVVYQIYPRSFADGNGDGTGDLAGMTARLGYLRDLGVDAVWINPWYRSPLLDGGYDVADYRRIDPRFGSTEEAMGFIVAAHDHGIRVIVDLVPNHTSWEHEWFLAARAAPAGDPARRRYHIRDGRGPDGSMPPNDWQSRFGGPAWSRLADGQWYLHLFDVSQPDLDWTDEEVRAEFDDILTFWLDRGVDGFRVDVAHSLTKDPTYRDYVGDELRLGSHAPGHPHWDRDDVHPIIRRWRSILDRYDGAMMVAEAWVHRDRLPLYLRPDEYHQSFGFDLVRAAWGADAFRDAIDAMLAAAVSVGSTPTWVLANHDVVRPATRYGLPPDLEPERWLLDGPHDALDVDRGRRRATAATLLALALPGSAYLYQGDELALTEVHDLPEEVLDDPVWERSGHRRKGRDGCRVPIPWTEDGPSHGFGAADPWLPQPDRWGTMSVQAQLGSPDTPLEVHRRALAVRRRRLNHDESMTWLDAGPDVLAFARGSGVVCMTNMGTRSVAPVDGTVLVASSALQDGRLTPDSTVWIDPAG